MRGLTRLLEGKIKLKMNREKSAVARPWERKFLGFSFTNGTMPKRRIAPKAVLRFQARIRALTRRTRGVGLEKMVRDVSRYLQGWQGYFGFCQTPTVLDRFNTWIRRRLGSAACKQWRTGKTRYARLRKSAVLIFQSSQLLSLAGFHAAELRLPGVDRVLGHTALPGFIVRRSPCVHLPQRSYDLRFAVLAPAHLHPPSNPKSYLRMCGFRGAGDANSTCRPPVDHEAGLSFMNFRGRLER